MIHKVKHQLNDLETQILLPGKLKTWNHFKEFSKFMTTKPCGLVNIHHPYKNQGRRIRKSPR